MGVRLPLRVKGFPRPDLGVLLPTHDRRTAALGVSMFTASRPPVLAAQALAFWSVRLLGTAAVPGRAQWWDPMNAEEWDALSTCWQDAVGPFDSLAAYRRKQTDRGGLTLQLTRDGTSVAVVKVRDAKDPVSLGREQRALAAASAFRPSNFRVPRALGEGTCGGWSWSAQTGVFARPHRPVLDAPDELFDEVNSLLGTLDTPSGTLRMCHNDVTPWNLRRDHRGQIWLIDWEDWGPAPHSSDLAYFVAASSALTSRPVLKPLPTPARDYCRWAIDQRSFSSPGDQELRSAMLGALDSAPHPP